MLCPILFEQHFKMSMSMSTTQVHQIDPVTQNLLNCYHSLSKLEQDICQVCACVQDKHCGRNDLNEYVRAIGVGNPNDKKINRDTLTLILDSLYERGIVGRFFNSSCKQIDGRTCASYSPSSRCSKIQKFLLLGKASGTNL